MANEQKQPRKDGKTRYTKAQIEEWKREMEAQAYGPNSTYFHLDNEQ